MVNNSSKKNYMNESDISYVISVKLYPGCYRHIQISGSATLNDLAVAILEAFGFDDDHLSAFYMSNKLYDRNSAYGVSLFPGIPIDTPYEASDYTLNYFHFKKGQKFIYLFDYGDEWEFNCSILRILDKPTKNWEIIKSVGEDPDQYGYDY